MNEDLVAIDFEIYGIVQGVFFRKSTQEAAVNIGVTGWCRNTRNDTVEGHIEGHKEKVVKMKHWLANVGSKSCRIDKAEFKNEKVIEKFTITSFEIRR